MIKKSILLLTNRDNGQEEDDMTAGFLQKNFDIELGNLETCEPIEQEFDLILVRNTWPRTEAEVKGYIQQKQDFFKRAKDKKLPIYNSLDAKCDRWGKGYLLELFSQGFPVIPSVRSPAEMAKLPKAKEYVVKPLQGFDAFGIQTVAASQLDTINGTDYIIQPRLSFRAEVSFYFVDKKLQYALIFRPNKVPCFPKPEVYFPSPRERAFAQAFADWNTLDAGIERIDALQLFSGQMLLLEIEDDSPYLCLPEIPTRLSSRFFQALQDSLLSVLSR